jgi:hypothetical protein
MQGDQDRTRRGCLCCGCQALRRETTLVSGFLAERAWGGLPEVTEIAFCDRCGFRFFARGLSDQEASALYRNYRDGNYFQTRNRWEPFYTRARHEQTIAWSRAPSRVDDLRRTFARAGLPERFSYVLDHGGNEGHMLKGVDADRKVVFDPSGREVLPGITAVSDPTELLPGCDLLLSCQVLEHVSDPVSYLRQVAALCADGACVYIEVPDESWSNRTGHGWLRDAWLNFLVRQRHLLAFFDMLSTGCRVKLGFLPPLGFIPMREHLNYFTIQALESILVASDLEPILSGRNGEMQLFAIARKTAPATRDRASPNHAQLKNL